MSVLRHSSLTHDTSAWIFNTVSVHAMAKPARRRAAVHQAARLFAAQVMDCAIAPPLPEQRPSMHLRARAVGPAELRDRRRPLPGRTRAVRRLQQRAPDRARRRRRLRAQRRHQARQRPAGIEVITIADPEPPGAGIRRPGVTSRGCVRPERDLGAVGLDAQRHDAAAALQIDPVEHQRRKAHVVQAAARQRQAGARACDRRTRG